MLLTKTGAGGVDPMFGSLPKGATVTTREREGLQPHEAFASARAKLKRSNPDENTMEWDAEVVE